MMKSVELFKATIKRDKHLKELSNGDIFKYHLRYYILTPAGAIDLKSGEIKKFDDYDFVTLVDIEKYC